MGAVEIEKDAEELDEDIAQQLLLDQERELHTQEEREPVVVCLVRKETIMTRV